MSRVKRHPERGSPSSSQLVQVAVAWTCALFEGTLFEYFSSWLKQNTTTKPFTRGLFIASPATVSGCCHAMASETPILRAAGPFRMRLVFLTSTTRVAFLEHSKPLKGWFHIPVLPGWGGWGGAGGGVRHFYRIAK